MIAIFDVFVNNLLPIFLCAGAGYLVGRATAPDIRSINRLAFFIFSPCLVFASLTETPVVGGEFAQIMLFTAAFLVAMAGLAGLTGLALRLNRQALATLVVAATFVNGGNYGLAATQFAFGDDALARALVFYIASTLGVYTLGVFVASLGRQSAGGALKEILSVPAFYALMAAGLARGLGWELPLFATRAIHLLGEAAIPVMLVILGLQIARTPLAIHQWGPAQRKLIAAGVILQLGAAPLLALALAAALGLSGFTWQAVVLEAAMPTAVITTVLAVQYDLDVEPMTLIVVASTLLSPLTLTPLIVFLQTAAP